MAIAAGSAQARGVRAIAICVVLAGTGSLTVTTKLADPVAPAIRLPMVNVQVVPARLPLAQLQPLELPAAVNVVLIGTVSLITTPVSPTLPVFW